MKKLMSLFLAVTMMVSLSSVAFAAEQNQPSDVASSAEEELQPGAAASSFDRNKDVSGPVDAVLNGMVRGSSPPSSLHNLGGSDYTATMYALGTAKIYTNKYFKCNSDGEINVDFALDGWSSTNKVKIGLYDCNDKKEVATWTSASFGNTSTYYAGMYFYNLDKNHYYAITFTCPTGTVEGTAWISH